MIAIRQRNQQRHTHNQQLRAQRCQKIPRLLRPVIEKDGLFKHVSIDTTFSFWFPPCRIFVLRRYFGFAASAPICN